MQYIHSCLSVLLNSVSFINTGQYQKGFALKNTVDFHSFFLEFNKQSVHGMIHNIVICPQALNTFIGYSINLLSFVNQTLKRTVEDPGFLGETRMPQQQQNYKWLF